MIRSKRESINQYIYNNIVLCPSQCGQAFIRTAQHNLTICDLPFDFQIIVAKHSNETKQYFLDKDLYSTNLSEICFRKRQVSFAFSRLLIFHQEAVRMIHLQFHWWYPKVKIYSSNLVGHRLGRETVQLYHCDRLAIGLFVCLYHYGIKYEKSSIHGTVWSIKSKRFRLPTLKMKVTKLRFFYSLYKIYSKSCLPSEKQKQKMEKIH